MNVREFVRRHLSDAIVVLIGFLVAKWWGLAFAIICVVIGKFGMRALVLNALGVLALMVVAVLLEGNSAVNYTFVATRTIANELGLLLIVAVAALVIPRAEVRQ